VAISSNLFFSMSLCIAMFISRDLVVFCVTHLISGNGLHSNDCLWVIGLVVAAILA